MNKQIVVTLDAKEHALICRALEEVQIGIANAAGWIYAEPQAARLEALEALQVKLKCLEKSDE